MSFNYCGFGAGVHLASVSIGQGELSTSSPILSEIVAAWRLKGRGAGTGEIQPQEFLGETQGRHSQLWAPAKLGAGGVWYPLQPQGSALVNKKAVPHSW